MSSLRENHLLCFSAWTAEASWEDRYMINANTHIYISTFHVLPCLHVLFFFNFRVTSLRSTALSGKCCRQMDTLASCPRTTELLCLWHLNDPQTSTQSPSLASCRSGIHRQWRACLNRHQTGRDILKWTLAMFLEWAHRRSSVLSFQTSDKNMKWEAVYFLLWTVCLFLMMTGWACRLDVITRLFENCIVTYLFIVYVIVI